MFGYLYGSSMGGVLAAGTANAARTEAEEARAEAQHLQNSLHQLAIANEALWQLLSEKLQISEDELRAKIATVEQLHSQQVGPQLCPSCHRPTNKNLSKCYYCGADLGPKTIFGQ